VVLLACTSVQAQQICEADISLQSTPTERFEDNGDGTVTDRKLKLMWTRCSAGQTWMAGTCSGQAGTYTWESAGQWVNNVNLRGTFFYSDWRLPQLREIATLIERQCSNPRVNLAVFPNTPAGLFWSVTPRAGGSDKAQVYVMGFGNDGVDYQTREQLSHVRLVRRSQ
jgi:hypothetical protein